MSSVVNKVQTYFCTNGLTKLTSHPERAAFLFVMLIKQLDPFAASLRNHDKYESAIHNIGIYVGV